MAVNPFQYAVSQVQKKAQQLFNQSPYVQGAHMYGRMAQSKPVQNFVQQATRQVQQAPRVAQNYLARQTITPPQINMPLQTFGIKPPNLGQAGKFLLNNPIAPVYNVDSKQVLPNNLLQAFPKDKDYFNPKTTNRERVKLMQPVMDRTMVGLTFAGPEAKGFNNATGKFSSLADKKPRFEISDRQAFLRNKNLDSVLPKDPHAGITVTRLENILDHQGLYRQYPELKKLRVMFQDKGATKGSFDPRTYTLTLNPNATKGEIRSTLLHEIQHVIQTKEGFARGGRPSQFSSTIDKSKIKTAFNKFLNDNPEAKTLWEKTKNLTGDDYLNSPEAARLSSILENKGWNKQKRAIASPMLSADDQYRRLAGEVEARDVQAREALSPQQRRYQQPYASQGIPLKDQIVKMNDGISQSKPLPKELEGLAAEARKYKSAEEFVQFEGKSLFRGTTDNGNKLLKSGEIPKEGLSVTLDPAIAQKYAQARGLAGYTTENFLSPNAKTITLDEIPNSVRSSGEGTDFAGKAAIWARKQGYDVLDMTKGNEVEMRILNNKALISKQEQKNILTDIFNQASVVPKYGKLSSPATDAITTNGAIGKSYNANPSKALQPSEATNANLHNSIIPNSNIFNQSKGVQNADLSFKLPVSPQLKVVNGKLKVKMKPIESPKIDDPFLKGLDADQIKLQQQTVPKVAQPLVSQVQKSPKEPILRPEQQTPFDNILRSSGDDVKKKVNLFDYLFTTPKEVLKRIGLKDVGENLQKADDGYQTELRTGLQKIRGWMDEAPSQESSKKIFQYLDGQKVKLSPQEAKVAGEIKPYLAQWAKRLKLPDDKRIAEYITHVFDFDSVAKEFDPEVARLIQDKVPSSVYNPFLQKRLGKLGYKEDVWSSLEAYVKRASRKEAFDPVLREVSKEADRLDPETAKYLQRYVSGINMRPSEVENLLDNAIKQSPIGYKLGQRPSVYLSSQWRKAVGRGTLGLNVGSAVRNLTQGVNTYAKLGEKYTLLGYGKLAKRMATNNMDELIKNNILDENIAIDRTMSAKHKAWQALDDTLYKFFDLAEKINRGSAYFGAKAKGIADGMDESKAIEYAKEIVRQTQFKYGPVDSPVLLQRSLGKSVGQFMTYPIKQTEFLKNLVKDKEYKAIVRYVMGSFVVVAGVGKTLGIEPQDFVPWLQNMQQGRFGSPLIQTAQTSLGLLSSDEQKREKAADDLKKSWRMVVPAGTQINKTIEGLTATGRGYGESPSGRIRYPLPQDTGAKIKGAVFGQYGFPQAQEYFDKVGKGEATPLGDTQSATFKALDATGRDQYYQAIMDRRQAGRDAKPKEPSTLDKGTDFIKNLLKTDNTPRKQSFQETDSPIAVEATDNTTQARIKAVEDEEVKMLKELIKSGTSIPQGTPLPSVMKAYGYGSPVKNYEGLNAIQKAKLDGQTDTRATRLYFDTKVPEKVKDSFWKDMGTTRQDAEFKALASLGDTQQASILFNLLKEREWKTDKVNTFIDKNVLTSSVVGKMEDQGLINEAQAKDLKAYIKNQNVKLGKAKPAKGKKPKKLKIPKLKAIKVKYTKLKVKIPKPKKFKSLLAKPKKNKYFV